MLVAGACNCKISLGYKSQGFSPDWQAIQVVWNGRVQAADGQDPYFVADFCNFLLASTSLVTLKQDLMKHSCYLKYDILTKKTTFTIRLNPAWAIPLNADKTPSFTITLNTNKVWTPECGYAMDTN
jgi:hypothetical protein